MTLTSTVAPAATARPAREPVSHRRRPVPRAAGAGRANRRCTRSARRAVNASLVLGRSRRRMSASSATSAYSGSVGSPARVASIAISAPAISWPSGSLSGPRIEVLPPALHGSIQQGSRGGFADPQDLGQLRVAQPGVELERDDLAVARRELGERGANRGPAQRHLGLVVVLGLGHVLGIDGERRHALATAQFVQRGIARDAEQPRALLAAPAIEGHTAPIGPLEGERGDVLGGGAVVQERRHVGEDVVPARAIEQLEALPGVLGGATPAGLRLRLSLDHHPHYAPGWVPSPRQLDIFVPCVPRWGQRYSGPQFCSRPGPRLVPGWDPPGSPGRSTPPSSRAPCGRRSTS